MLQDRADDSLLEANYAANLVFPARTKCICLSEASKIDIAKGGHLGSIYSIYAYSIHVHYTLTFKCQDLKTTDMTTTSSQVIKYLHVISEQK